MDETTLAKLTAVVGTHRKAVVEADGIPTRVHPGMEVEAYPGRMSTVAAVYTDFLGNEAYVTEYHLNRHISKIIKDPDRSAIISGILDSPEHLYHDKKLRAIMYGRFFDDLERYLFVCVGQDSRQVFTVERKGMLFTNRERKQGKI